MTKGEVAVVIGVVMFFLMLATGMSLDGKDKREACAKLAAEITSTDGKVALITVCK